MNAPQSNPALRPRRRQPVAMLVLMVVVLVAGTAIGVGLTVLFPEIPRAFTSRGRKWSEMSTEQMADRHIERLSRRLDLTDDQARELRPIMIRRTDVFLDAFDRIRPELMESLREMDAEVRSVLTEDQIPAWEKYYKRRAAMYKPRTPASAPAEEAEAGS